MAQEDPKTVIIHAIIDVQALIDFYKDDNNPAWGTDKDYPCKADSFCVLISSQAYFTGSNKDILVLEQGCIYIWEISSLNNEPLDLDIYGEENKIIMEMMKKVDSKEHPEEEDWGKLISLNDKVCVDKDNGKLIISEKNPEQDTYNFEITTLNPFQLGNNLTYSIKFTFHDGSTKRYGVIDPFIKVRSDDETDP